MKCDSCRFNKHHYPGSHFSVAECGDDPYDYDYCEKLHWGGGEIPDEEDYKAVQGGEDLWANCADYEKEEGE